MEEEQGMELSEYILLIKEAFTGLIEEANEARMLGKYRTFRAKYNEAHELVFEHTQLILEHVRELGELAKREDSPTIKKDLVDLEEILRKHIKDISEPLNNLALVLAVEVPEDDSTYD